MIAEPVLDLDLHAVGPVEQRHLVEAQIDARPGPAGASKSRSTISVSEAKMSPPSWSWISTANTSPSDRLRRRQGDVDGERLPREEVGALPHAGVLDLDRGDHGGTVPCGQGLLFGIGAAPEAGPTTSRWSW